MSGRTLLGMITPSSNTVLEPLTSRMLDPLYPGVTAHFSRVRVSEITLEQSALDQFNNDPMMNAARLLADAYPASIAWNGTSASWLGFGRDEQLCDQILQETGKPAFTSVTALNTILRLQGVSRLGLVTPYTSDVQRRIIENYQAMGVECVSEVHFGEHHNFRFAEFSDAALKEAIRSVAAHRPQAIIILCTNLRAAHLTAAMEQETGIPIYDSVAAVVWQGLRLAELDTAPLAHWGSLFKTY